MRKPIFLLTLLLTTVTAVAQDSKQAVLACLKTYRDAIMAGDTAKAIALTATFPKMPSELLEETTQNFVDLAKTGKLKMWIYPSSLGVVENCAVVVISDHEKPAPDDPAYFILQNGKWKILPDLTNWDRDYMEFSDKERHAFAQLQEMYEQSQKRLRAESTAKAE